MIYIRCGTVSPMSVRPTWEERELLVLRAVLDLVETQGEDDINPTEIAQFAGFDEATVQASLRALGGGQPPFFAKINRNADGDAYLVSSPTERARRAVGLWPTPEDLADRFIEAFEKAAEEAQSEEQRTTYRKIARLARDAGISVLVSVTSRILTGQVGG
jgi:hypothetical protein